MSKDAHTSSIESELLQEVQQELERRGTTIIREPQHDLPAALCASALLACLALLAGTGVGMALGYAPSAEDAAVSLAWLEQNPAGALIRAMHFHASNLIVLLALAYLGLMAWRGLYRRPGQWRWWRGALLLILLLAAGFTGQLLPFDQNALHGTQIRLSYVAEVPLVGGLLHAFLAPGDEPGTAALSRFFVLHILVLPALLLLLTRWLWRDARAELLPQLITAGVVVALVAGAALLWSAPLGLTGTLSEPYNDARPEWYALALFELLKWLPAGAMQVSALVGPPLLFAAVVVALPFIEHTDAHEPRLRWPVRIAMLVAVVGMAGMSAATLISDASDDAGWFAKDDVESLMLAMGRRNDALGNSGEALPHTPHLAAHDLRLLHQRLIGVYPDDLDEAAKRDWNQWARDGEQAVLDLLNAANADEQRAARARLRETCAACHEAHDKEEVPLDPPRGGAEARAARFFDSAALLEARQAAEPLTLPTTRVMDRANLRMRDILAHAEVIDHATFRESEQALVELRRAAERIAELWEDNAGSWADEGRWSRWSGELLAAVDRLAEAEDADDVAGRMAEVGRSCEGCHEDGEDTYEPVPWRYQDLLQGPR